MTLAIIIVVAAALSLVVILRFVVSRSLTVSGSSDLASQLQPIDIEAFRNLLNPEDERYLFDRLSPAQYRLVRRARLRAVAAYVKVASSNAKVLVRIGEAALATNSPRTEQAARQLVNDALLLRVNSTFAMAKIYLAIAWPTAGAAGVPFVESYARLSGSAMLLGRLQNPVAPIHVSASRF